MLHHRMWKTEPTNGWRYSAIAFGEQYPDALAALLRNVTHYMIQLNAARSHRDVQALYLTRLQSGLIAIDQNGMDEGLEESRIYAFPDDSKQILYLVCTGKLSEKDSHMEYCKNFVLYLLAEKTNS